MPSIRRAHPRDADQIARLAADAAKEEGVISALESDRIRAHAFSSNPLIEIWVAEERKPRPVIVGHAAITKHYDFRRAQPLVSICELYVCPEHRRGGLARRLMSAIAGRAMELGARDLTITTGVGNAAAERFFSSVGARADDSVVYVMAHDGVQWLATEGL